MIQLWLVTIIANVFLLACQSASDKGADSTSVETLAVDTPPLAEPLDAEFNSYSKRYCQDDNYTKHLRENFAAKAKDSSKSPKKIKSEANFETYRTLNQKHPMFFGGIPVEATERVYSWIVYFTGRGRQEFLRWLVRGESYKPLVLPHLEKEGLPTELFYLAMIESGFSNSAFSRAAATGTWQFMKPTALYYGLDVNYWVDERRDPVKSTVAAARYLKDLHRQLKDWYLAVAAYNAGPGKIIRAMRHAQTRDYWALTRTPHILPETKNYVPKMLAAMTIAKHPQNYGFEIVKDLRNLTPSTTISLKNPYRLQDIADKLQIPLRELNRWNPEIIRGITPPQKGMIHDTYQLRLPQPLASAFADIEDTLEQLSVQDVQLHKIRKGETLDHIAKRYRISIKQILQFNPQLNPQRLKPGRTINVPVPQIMTGKNERIPSAG